MAYNLNLVILISHWASWFPSHPLSLDRKNRVYFSFLCRNEISSVRKLLARNSHVKLFSFISRIQFSANIISQWHWQIDSTLKNSGSLRHGSKCAQCVFVILRLNERIFATFNPNPVKLTGKLNNDEPKYLKWLFYRKEYHVTCHSQ